MATVTALDRQNGLVRDVPSGMRLLGIEGTVDLKDGGPRTPTQLQNSTSVREHGAAPEEDNAKTPVPPLRKGSVQEERELSPGIGAVIPPSPPRMRALGVISSHVTESPSRKGKEREIEGQEVDTDDMDVSANVSGASSPEGDSDKPLNRRVSVPLQRGDSTSSDSSVSGLSRASSSSSVYATPFRMTPFRTPGIGSRNGSYVGERTSYFQTTPARFGRGGIASTRNSFGAGFAGAARPLAVPSGNTAHDVAMHALGPEASAEAGIPQLNGLGPSLPTNGTRHRVQDPAATIGPTPAAAYAAEMNRTPRPPNISLPPASAIFASSGGPADGYKPNHLRPPPSPGAELLLQASRPRPGLGSRTVSNASIGVNMHKRAADFDLGEVLGEGSYSTVFLATDKFPPHKQYALKVLDKKHIIKERKVKYVNVEKDTLARLDKHPGIVRLYWTFHDEQSLYFVLELASNGEILKYIKDYGSFEVTGARFYAAQLLSALEHMHKKGVIHRDIKPENILLDSKMRVKVTDFGTAKLLPTSPSAEVAPGLDEVQSRSNSFVGTAQYVSPELLTAKPVPITSSDPNSTIQALPPPACADFWAFGCVLYQFICGRTPFRAPNEYLIFQKITKLEYDFPEDFPEDAKDLIRRLLVLNPFDRLGAKEGVEEIKGHPFFASIDWNNIWTLEPPVLKTGITPPSVFPKQILALEESSHDDDASEEGSDSDDQESLAEVDGEGGQAIGVRIPSRSEQPPLPDMLPPASPIAARRRASAAGSGSLGEVPFPALAGSVQQEALSHHSSDSSAGMGSRPGSAVSTGSMQREQNGYVFKRRESRDSRGEQSVHSRSRSGSGGRWSKLLNLPRNALLKVKTPAVKAKPAK